MSPPLVPRPEGMPPENTTTKLPAVAVPQSTLDAVLSELKGLREDVREVASDNRSIKVDLRDLKEWRGDVEERLRTHSTQVRGESSSNLKQDAVIGTLVSDVSSVKADVSSIKTDLANNSTSTELIRQAVTGVGGFLKQHPQFVAAAVGCATAACGWFAHWFSTGAH